MSILYVILTEYYSESNIFFSALIFIFAVYGWTDICVVTVGEFSLPSTVFQHYLVKSHLIMYLYNRTINSIKNVFDFYNCVLIVIGLVYILYLSLSFCKVSLAILTCWNKCKISQFCYYCPTGAFKSVLFNAGRGLP